MPRREHDLLAVFRSPRGGGGKGSEPERAKGPKRRFEGVFLLPRQLLLGSSVVVLLLVLSFTVGLGVGRSSGKPAASPPLQRASTGWVLRGRMSAMDLGRGEDLSPARVTRELESRYSVPARLVRVEAGRDAVRVTIGPFATREEAAQFLADHRLGTARLGSAAPFRSTVPEALSPR